MLVAQPNVFQQLLHAIRCIELKFKLGNENLLQSERLDLETLNIPSNTSPFRIPMQSLVSSEIIAFEAMVAFPANKKILCLLYERITKLVERALSGSIQMLYIANLAPILPRSTLPLSTQLIIFAY